MMAAESRAQVAATLVFVAGLLLVSLQAPAWTVGIALACAGWRLLVTTGQLRPLKPRRGMRFLFGALTALMVVAVLMSFRTLNGLAAGTALLVLMGALKLLESRGRRDDAIVIGVALFMLLAAALADQSLLRLPLYLLVVWGACAAMMLVAHHASGLSVRAALRLSARALAMAVPLAVVCFLFFPRFGGQFWALPRGGEASTGLGDEMAPGVIDRLVADYEPAFRARFDGRIPPPEARYWRGPVLSEFDGFTWRRAPRYMATPIKLLGEPVRYRITLEPTQRNWLFALDTLAESPRYGMFLGKHDQVLVRAEPVDSPISYDAVSYLDSEALGPLTTLGRRYETALPAGRNPRAIELARELRAASSSDADYLRRVLDWFASNGLEYTLEPDRTGRDSVDSVLFDTRRGFCGHFASAYATLMRAAGLPARVVTGYLGGEWNPLGGYFIVRQSDAHAWTEVWLDGRGWVRVDPTTVVEPERLSRGVYDVLETGSLGLTLRRTTWLAEAARLWDGVNTWWRDRVLDFNMRAQLAFLRNLGIDEPGWRHLGWAFGITLTLWLLWVALTIRRSVARVKPDRIARAWLEATRKLARVAPARAADEGAMDYARRVGEAQPQLREKVMSLASRYTRLRFGADVDEAELRELERLVRKWGHS